MRRLVFLTVLLLSLAPACRRREPVAPNPNVANRVAMRQVRLYYGSPRMLLQPEVRSVPLPESAAAALPVVLRELVKGPATGPSMRLLPADALIRGAWLLPGQRAVVDLGGSTLSSGWGTGSHQEILAIYSIIHTVTVNFPEAREVRLLVNGGPAETLGGHISLSKAFRPRPALNEGG